MPGIGIGISPALKKRFVSSTLTPIGVVANDDFNSGNFSYIGSGTTVTYLGGNSIRMVGGTNVFGNLVRYNNWVSGSEKFTIKKRFTPNVINASSLGASLEIQAYDTGLGNRNRFAMYCDCESDAMFQGLTTLVLYDGLGVQNSYNSGLGSVFSISAGDTIELEIKRDVNPSTNQYRITATSRKIGAGDVVLNSNSISVDVSYAYPSTNELNNTFRIGFGNINGDNTITSWSYTVDQYKNIDCLFIGDSKTTGLYTTNSTYRFPNLIGATGKSIEVNGGPSNRLQDAVNAVEEYKKYLPSKVFIFLGCNDVRGNNLLNATAVTRTQTIKTALESVGATVYVCSSSPENGWDFTTYNAALLAAFPTAYIDLFTPLKDGGTGINAIYTDDGIHPNNAANVIIKNTLLPYC